MADGGATSGLTRFLCPMCPFQAPSMALNLSHLRLVHGNDSNFHVQCGIGSCSYTAKSFSTFYSHIYRKHPDSGVIQKRDSQKQQQNPAISESTSSQQSDQCEIQGEYMDTGKYQKLFCVPSNI